MVNKTVSDNNYVLHLTAEQFENLKNDGSFNDVEYSYTEGPNGEILVVLRPSDYEAFQTNVFQISVDAEAGMFECFTLSYL